MHELGPFSIPSMRDFVPEKLRPWIVLIFAFIFQISGGVYLAAVAEMVGTLALKQEDIMMAGYASLISLALTFTVMFRLKFRFPSKTALLTCAFGVIACNLVCMHTGSVPILVATCFVAGFFRMWGTFECNSTIQLWLTPKRDLSIFFCYIELLVQGSMQCSGLMAIYTAFFTTWEYMHWLVIGLLGLMIILTATMFRNYRTMKRLPLWGIDWLGATLWGGVVMCIVFICVYGDFYDWFQSLHIQITAIAGIIMLLMNLWRASFIHHPFIDLKTWKYKPVYETFILYIIIELLVAPEHVFEHALMESVLGYDSLNLISLNWIVILGTAVGAFYTYQVFALRKWSYKRMMVVALSAIVGYLMIFYFTIDYNLSKEAFLIPIFLRSFGHIIIGICFLTVLSRVPFQIFFQTLSIQAFVSACFGGALGAAILGHTLKVLMKQNAMLISTNMDNVNPIATHMPLGELYGMVQQQALMVSMKEILGWLVMLGIFLLFLLLARESSWRPHGFHPKFRTIRRLIKHELKLSEE